MPLHQFFQSLNGTCRHCRQQAGVFQRDHPDCQETHRSGWQEMVHSPHRPPVPTPSTRPPSGRPSRPSPSAPAPPARTSTAPSRRASRRAWPKPWPTASSPVTRRSASEPSGTASPWRTAPPTRARWQNWTRPGQTGLCWRPGWRPSPSRTGTATSRPGPHHQAGRPGPRGGEQAPRAGLGNGRPWSPGGRKELGESAWAGNTQAIQPEGTSRKGRREGPDVP